MLPALPQIGIDLGVANPNDRQLVVSMIFLGSAIGQLFLGPLSDNTGRKPAIYLGFGMYVVGALVCVLSINFPMLLVGRVFQGLGLSASQAVMMALVRDHFEGRRMARVMSFSMMVFILIPMLAPTVGQFIFTTAGWRAIFGVFMIFAIIAITWFSFRIPETLEEVDRAPFSLKRILWAFGEIVKIPATVGFAVAAGVLNGIFLGYLNSSQQIFMEQYALGERFPIIFAIISLSLGLAALTNTRLVMKYGMKKLVSLALPFEFGLAAVFLVIVLVLGGQPPLWSLIAYLMLFFFSTGILMGNMNTLAMQPLAHLAGIGAASIGAFSTLLSMSFGTLIGRSYNGTVTPLVLGMVLLTGSSLLIVWWALSRYTGTDE
jgi:DHA1 family bicyclomycin/chloramphenicol resistance-like MFS transporter